MPADELDDFAEAQKSHSLRRENDRLKTEVKQLNDQLTRALGRLDILEGVDRLNPEPPRWLMPKRPGPADTLVLAILSDTHFDEVVRPEDVAGVNAYDRRIATKRLKSWATQLAAMPETGPSAKVNGLVLMLGGDFTCGLIDGLHLVDSDDTLLGTLLYWSEQLAAAITLLADAYGRVHLPVVIGNHGRMTAKKRTHLAARDNSDWHLCHLVRRLLADDRRLTWQIDEASDADFMVFDQRHVLTHGDQTSGGSGIGGIFPPIQRMVARKSQRQAALGRPFQHLWLGHFHQALWGPNWGVNGSLKGADGFSMANNWLTGRPEQLVAFATRSGLGWRTTITVD
jgi:hypothetical protein